MRKALALILALASPLLFPAFLAAVIVAGASVVLPPVGILAGVLADALYRAPSVFPYATVFGAIATVVGFFVRRFIKTRIMGA